MGVAEWLLVAAIVCVFAFIILRPDRWGKRDNATGSEGGFYAADRRDDDNDGGDGGD